MTIALIFSAASLVVSGFSFLFFFRYLKRRTGQERILAEFRDEVDKLLLQIDEVTDRDLTLVEERNKILRTLLEDTDRRIAVYAREVDRRRSQEEAFAAYDRVSPSASRFGGGYTRQGTPLTGEPLPARSEAAEPVLTGSAEATSGVERAVPVEQVALSGLPPPETGTSGPFGAEHAVPAESATTAASTITEPPASGAQNPRFLAEFPARQGQFPRIVRSSRPIEPKPLPFAERVNELYRAGFSANLIAAQLGVTIAAVELAIALGGRNGGADNG
ncbi:hypothetical protein FACS1894130_09770 [Spirochaetia bacterium]|nr:hypothetical protein FACS1894130_09770 [Spirochaetia bacterium]